MKNLLLILPFIVCLLSCSKDTEAQQPKPEKKIRDSVLVNSDIFTIMYSEKLEQPLWVKYQVKCPSGTASRTGLDFYTNDSIHTSNDSDYVNNIYDKGHMAPAAGLNCSRDMVIKTFTYLNCSLQHQDLNRNTWRHLENYERNLAKIYGVVKIRINCVYTQNSIKLPTGATVPDAYYKTIYFNDSSETYYFHNEKPKYSDFKMYLVK